MGGCLSSRRNATLRGHSNRVLAVACYADATTGAVRVVTGSDDKTAMIWRTMSKKDEEAESKRRAEAEARVPPPEWSPSRVVV